MDIELTVAERFAIMGILPEKGNIVTIKLLREFKEAVAFNEQEVNAIELNLSDEGKATWIVAKEKKIGKKKIELSDILAESIRSNLKMLDSKKQLTEAHVPIWDMFCEK